jgi:hypothetical protein
MMDGEIGSGPDFQRGGGFGGRGRRKCSHFGRLFHVKILLRFD